MFIIQSDIITAERRQSRISVKDKFGVLWNESLKKISLIIFIFAVEYNRISCADKVLCCLGIFQCFLKANVQLKWVEYYFFVLKCPILIFRFTTALAVSFSSVIYSISFAFLKYCKPAFILFLLFRWDLETTYRTSYNNTPDYLGLLRDNADFGRF